jgi:hypothetical protein
MPFTAGGFDLQAADVALPGYGIWSASVSLADAQALTIGARVQLVLSDLTLVGTVRTGGEFVGETGYFIVGGADGWAKACKKKDYRTDSGVKLSQVVRDLAAEVGETVVVLPAAERVVGYAWQRLAGAASSALRDLAGELWWLDADGNTYVGTRPASQVSASLEFAVKPYDPRWKRAGITSPDDLVAPFLPGATFTAETLADPFTVQSMTVRVRTGSVALEVRG